MHSVSACFLWVFNDCKLSFPGERGLPEGDEGAAGGADADVHDGAGGAQRRQVGQEKQALKECEDILNRSLK